MFTSRWQLGAGILCLAVALCIVGVCRASPAEAEPVNAEAHTLAYIPDVPEFTDVKTANGFGMLVSIPSRPFIRSPYRPRTSPFAQPFWRP